MKNLIHLLDSDEPLTGIEGRNVQANCLEVVARVEFAFLWDDEICGESFEELLANTPVGRLCKKCRNISLEKRYVCGIRTRQEKSDAVV